MALIMFWKFLLVLFLVVGIAEVGRVDHWPWVDAVLKNSEPAHATDRPTYRYTKDDLRKSLIGKTRSQVKDLLGRPSATSGVGQATDAWFYWASDLPVYDPDAEIMAGDTNILFNSMTGTVIGVSF